MVPYDACLSKAGAILGKKNLKRKKINYSQHALVNYIALDSLLISITYLSPPDHTEIHIFFKHP